MVLQLQGLRANLIPEVVGPRLQALEELLIGPGGQWKILPSAVYDDIDHLTLRFMCHRHAIYGIVTTELVEWLALELQGKQAVEIGAGAGGLGRALGIPMTDADIQSRPEVALYYQAVGQPTIKLPRDVRRMDAKRAVSRYRPHTVVGSWITQRGSSGDASIYGVDEERMLQRVRRYILIGHHDIHRNKRIMSLPHETYRFPWLRSRAKDPSKNCIYVWAS